MERRRRRQASGPAHVRHGTDENMQEGHEAKGKNMAGLNFVFNKVERVILLYTYIDEGGN